MPRRPRIQAAGATYHVTARGNAGAAIFLDDFDRLHLLDQLARTVRDLMWSVFAYCLMNNHYHLLVRTPEPNLSDGMKRMHNAYVRRFNARHSRRGHVFGDRFHDVRLEGDEHLLSAAAYTVLNPVRAGMVARPEEWRWSSCRATVGLEPAPAFVDVDALLALFQTTSERARESFSEMVEAGLAKSG